MKIRMLFFRTAILLMALSVGGCVTDVARFEYPYRDIEETSLGHAVVDDTLRVEAFSDARATLQDLNPGLFCLIPLPLGYVRFFPERSAGILSTRKFDFTPTTDLAEAAATSLRGSGLFAEVYCYTPGWMEPLTSEAFLERETYMRKAPPSRFVLTGRVLMTNWSGGAWFGNALFVFPLSIIGFPCYHCGCALQLELTLCDSLNGKVVWHDTFEANASVMIGYYYNRGEDYRCFAVAMQEIMETAIEELGPVLRRYVRERSVRQSTSI